MAEPPKRKSFQSSLEAHPEHVRAIGMISIESGNLDIMFGHLLAEVLDQQEQIGHAIYLTPRSAMARIEIFRNVVKYAYLPLPTDGMDDEPRKLSEHVNKRRKNDQRRIEALLARAQAIVDKRNAIIHEGWGVHTDTQSVIRRKLPIKPGSQFTTVSLIVLTDIVRDLRVLGDDVIALRHELAWRRAERFHALARLPSLDKTQQPSQGKRRSRKTRSNPGRPKRKPPPRSSRA